MFSVKFKHLFPLFLSIFFIFFPNFFHRFLYPFKKYLRACCFKREGKEYCFYDNCQYDYSNPNIHPRANTKKTDKCIVEWCVYGCVKKIRNHARYSTSQHTITLCYIFCNVCVIFCSRATGESPERGGLVRMSMCFFSISVWCFFSILYILLRILFLCVAFFATFFPTLTPHFISLPGTHTRVKHSVWRRFPPLSRVLNSSRESRWFRFNILYCAF